MLAALEDTSVRSVVGGDELHESGGTTGMSLLYSAWGHGVGDSIEGQVHVLLEEASELVTDEESLGGVVSVDTLPDDLRFTVGAQGLVAGGVEVLVLQELFDWAVLPVDNVSVGGIAAETLTELLGCNNCTCEEGSSERKLHCIVISYYYIPQYCLVIGVLKSNRQSLNNNLSTTDLTAVQISIIKKDSV